MDVEWGHRSSWREHLLPSSIDVACSMRRALCAHALLALLACGCSALQVAGPLLSQSARASTLRCLPACACAAEGEGGAEGAAAEDGPKSKAEKKAAKAAVKAEKLALRERIAELERSLKDARGKLLATQDELADSGEKGYLLTAANFERYRIKSRGELEDQAGTGKLVAVRGMLPFIETFDAFQAQLDGADEDAVTIHKYYGGIYKQLKGVIDPMGLAPCEAAAGDTFDFLKHTRAESRASDDVAVDCVIECLKVGYTMGAQGLVRTAEVVVSTGPEKQEEEAPPAAAEETAGEEEAKET